MKKDHFIFHDFLLRREIRTIKFKFKKIKKRNKKRINKRNKKRIKKRI